MNTFSIVLANADQSAINSFLTALHLKQYKVFQATSLVELVDVMAKENIDLAVIDSNISPDLNKTVIAMLRRLNRHLKVIITSGNILPAFELDMRSSGITYFGTNPVDYAVIDGIIGKVWQRRREIPVP